MSATTSSSSSSRSVLPTGIAAHCNATTVSISDFQRLRLIGRGELGRVYLVRHTATQQLYAMKVLPKDEMIRKDKIKRVHTERELLQTAKHPFVVTLYWSFQNTACLYFVMDFCQGGEFFRALQRQPRRCLPEDGARFYAAEVLLGLEYLHMLGFIYRDLKPENILLTSAGHIVLTDFDLCKHAAKESMPQVLKSMFSDIRVKTEPGIVTNSFVGTEEYIAPEVIVGHGHTSSVDWWTFGILLYEMLFGCPPFRGKDREETFSQILLCTLKFPPHKFPVSKHALDIVKQLLRVEPNKRLGTVNGACDVKQHRFFAGVKWSMLRNQTPPIVPQLVDEEDTSYFPFLEDDDEVAKLEAAITPKSPPASPSLSERHTNDEDESMNSKTEISRIDHHHGHHSRGHNHSRSRSRSRSHSRERTQGDDEPESAHEIPEQVRPRCSSDSDACSTPVRERRKKIVHTGSEGNSDSDDVLCEQSVRTCGVQPKETSFFFFLYLTFA
eukprot:TRINITY_DN56_c0_g1_i2.p1 TRINITY_DN56_c0_g1~~TRINITY_DN56_c0_g1_i2.p1  ORF type:complete len:497 (+),score=91.34 TRINITY_DN56_c0_g1_i2:78-1568(+)